MVSKGKSKNPAAAWLREDTGFESRFKQSLIDRAKKRTLRVVADGWEVKGDAKLGDAYETYQVSLIPGSRTNYHCSCFDHMHGEKRARKNCSHILAVMLYRRRKGEAN